MNWFCIAVVVGWWLWAPDALAESAAKGAPYVAVLGVAQDAGYPQAGCHKQCCQRAWADVNARRRPASLAIVDPEAEQRWLVECTPQFVEQLQMLDAIAPVKRPGARPPRLDGILLTHAHIGHYAGLVHLGREVMGSREVPVYAMPRMREFLENHGPWSQLVTLKNIRVESLFAGRTIWLNQRLRITPLLVPHRDEFSETVAYRIEGPQRSVLFLPDIDKWDRWQTPIEDVVATVDAAYLDATFYDAAELPGRDMSDIPHPFVVETVARFAPLPDNLRAKVRLLHMNHTNPLLDPQSEQAKRVLGAGLALAAEGEQFSL